MAAEVVSAAPAEQSKRPECTRGIPKRNNSIDPSTLASVRPRRERLRGGKRGGPAKSNNESTGHDSIMSNSGTGGESESSFGSKWGADSVKFSAKNFVHQKAGTLEDFYDLGDLLGVGGFGEVYVCTHLETGEERAVKVMEKSLDKPEENEDIVREYNILKELDHPNILKVYEMFETKDFYFIVTDLYAGGDLFSELEYNGVLSETDAALLMNSMLMCLNYCHKRNLCHLDLKPENVLIAHEDKVSYSDIKIIDFGLAQQFEDNKEKMTEMEGSSYYMSPQVVARSYDGCKADVWSCGVMVHVLMTGFAPFDGPEYEDILAAITKGTFEFVESDWQGVSEECLDFISCCLTYDEAKRPTAEEALQHPFLKKMRNFKTHSNVKTRLSARKCLKQLELFNSQHSKFKQAACAIMSSQLLSKEEKDQIDEVFRSLDPSCDGHLDKDDLRQSYKEYYDTELSDEKIDNIFQQVNFSASGVIEYSEFAIATMIVQDNKVDDQKLTAAFKVFDKDGKGYISPDDIKRVLQLGDDQDEYLKKKILRQVGAEITQRIDLEDFKKIMRSNTSMQKKKKKPRMVRRTPRRSRSDSHHHANLADLKQEVLGASLLDMSGLDNSDLTASTGLSTTVTASPCVNHSRRQKAPHPRIFMEGLAEQADEDNIDRTTVHHKKADADSSQTSYDEEVDFDASFGAVLRESKTD